MMTRKVLGSNDDDLRVISRKEVAKLQRRAAYQRAKAARATDPRYLAQKQAAKEQRKQMYRVAKERNKAEAQKRAGEARSKAEQERAEARARSDAELMQLVTWVSKGSSAQN